MVKALLKHGANPNWHMNLVADSMPLHVAVDADLSKLGVHHLKLRAVVEALHEEGADPSIPDADGRLVEDKTSNSELKEILRRCRMMLSPAKEISLEHLYASEEHHR